MDNSEMKEIMQELSYEKNSDLGQIVVTPADLKEFEKYEKMDLLTLSWLCCAKAKKEAIFFTLDEIKETEKMLKTMGKKISDFSGFTFGGMVKFFDEVK